MNYQFHYNTLIERAKYRLIEGYVEKHHVIPQCMGGSNDPENFVALTPEEYHVAHQLLIKIYPDEPKLIYAAKMMTIGKRRNNKLYGWLRKKWNDGMKGENHPMFGKCHTNDARRKQSESHKGKKHTEETKQNISNLMKGQKRALGCKHSEESRRKRSERQKGQKRGPYKNNNKDI